MWDRRTELADRTSGWRRRGRKAPCFLSCGAAAVYTLPRDLDHVPDCELPMSDRRAKPTNFGRRNYLHHDHVNTGFDPHFTTIQLDDLNDNGANGEIHRNPRDLLEADSFPCLNEIEGEKSATHWGSDKVRLFGSLRARTKRRSFVAAPFSHCSCSCLRSTSPLPNKRHSPHGRDDRYSNAMSRLCHCIGDFASRSKTTVLGWIRWFWAISVFPPLNGSTAFVFKWQWWRQPVSAASNRTHFASRSGASDSADRDGRGGTALHQAAMSPKGLSPAPAASLLQGHSWCSPIYQEENIPQHRCCARMSHLGWIGSWGGKWVRWILLKKSRDIIFRAKILICELESLPVVAHTKNARMQRRQESSR